MLLTNRQNEESKIRQRRLQAGYLTHRTPCAPQGASERPVFPPYMWRPGLMSQQDRKHVTPGSQLYRVSPHHRRDLRSYQHALTGAWTCRMTPCPHGATDLQNVTTPSQHHSLTWCHRVLIKSQLYKMSLSPHRAMVLRGVTMAWQGNSPRDAFEVEWILFGKLALTLAVQKKIMKQWKNK